MDHEELPILSRDSEQEIEMLVNSEKTSTVDPSRSFVCPFSDQELGASESEERAKAATKLTGLILFYLVVMLVEILGGLKSNSLAVMSDAGHLLSDIAGFSISLFSVWASGWRATPRHSFGYHRLEILGALVSVQLIWLVSGILIYEAVNRLVGNSERVNGSLMFGVATFGFAVNSVMVFWLGHHHHHNHSHDHDHEHHDHHDHEKRSLNINVQGAYLHVVVDTIQSLGVMVAGAVIWAKPEWLVVDLVCTLVFSVVALSATVSMLKSVWGVLMERAPGEVDVARLASDLRRVKGVGELRDLHVWDLTVGKTVLTCHVEAEPGVDWRVLVGRIREYCGKTDVIHHVTVQIE